MNSHVPGSTNASSEAFPYQDLLDYYRGELNDPADRARVQSHLQKGDPRWLAQWESVQRLDLERSAVLQDVQDLQRLFRLLTGSDGLRVPIHPLTARVAQTCGTADDVLVKLFENRLGRHEGTLEEWQEHLDDCVYSRRMFRQVVAQYRERELGGPLLHDWLLAHHYATLLPRVTAALKEALSARLAAVAQTSEKLVRDVLTLLVTARGFSGWEMDERRQNLHGAKELAERLHKTAQWTWIARRFTPPRGGMVRTRGEVPTRGQELPQSLEFTRDLPANAGTLTARFDIQPGGMIQYIVGLHASAEALQKLPGLGLRVRISGEAVDSEGPEPSRQVSGEVALSTTPPGHEPLARPELVVQVLRAGEIWQETTFNLGA